jgi:EpsI family protein
MSAVRWRALVVLVCMAAAYVAALAWQPTAHLSDVRAKVDLETLFPRSFGEWAVDTRGPVQLVSPDQAALLNRIYNQTLSRTYANPRGDRIMLSVAYGGDQSDGTRAHRPEVCYPAQGFQIIWDKTDAVQVSDMSVPARKLIAKQGGRIEPITYWVTVGDRVALSGTQQKIAQLRYSVRGIIPDGMLVRVSTIDGESTRAFAVQERFLSDMSLALTGDARDRVFGSAP